MPETIRSSCGHACIGSFGAPPEVSLHTPSRHTSTSSAYTIAIDGPAASGKSSTAKRVAERLNFIRLDTGMLYRGMTYILSASNDDSAMHQNISGSDFALVDGELHYKGENITPLLRTPMVDSMISKVAAMPEVREKVHEIEREFIRKAETGIVVDGRDIGTVVMPDAFLKLFVTADISVRARRRFAQAGGDYAETLMGIKKRDYEDTYRVHGPLVQAEDAVLVSNDELTLDQTVDLIVDIFTKKKEEEAEKRAVVEKK